MMIQLTILIPAIVAIYAATGAWVFSCDPISKTIDVVRGGLLYGWIGVLFMGARFSFSSEITRRPECSRTRRLPRAMPKSRFIGRREPANPSRALLKRPTDRCAMLC